MQSNSVIGVKSLILDDPFEFARRGAILEGSIEVARMARLAEVSLGDPGRAVDYTVQGERSGDGLFLRLSVRVALVLECQRCLSEMECPVSAQTRLLLVPESEPLPDEALENDDFDPVHAAHGFDLLAALEDELLLAMPIAPMHAVACTSSEAAVADRSNSPFAVLGRLKKPGRA